MYQNGYEQYKMQSVNTMTRGEMLLLLFDELVKRLKEQDYDLFDRSVQRSREIVEYLNKTLDLEYEISFELRKMYDFFLFELSRLQAGRRGAVIEELKPLVLELRYAFAEANKKCKGAEDGGKQRIIRRVDAPCSKTVYAGRGDWKNNK